MTAIALYHSSWSASYPAGERDTVCSLGIPCNLSRQYSLFSGDARAGKSYMAIKDYHQSGGMAVLPLKVAMRPRVDGGAYCRDSIGVVISDYVLHVFVLYLVGDTHYRIQNRKRTQ